MSQTVILAAAILLIFFLYKIFSFLRTRNTHRDLAKKSGCGEAPVWPKYWWDVLGLQQTRQMLASHEKGRLMDFFTWRLKTLSEKLGRKVTTHSWVVLGTKGFFTTDPQNIQAMLAKQFNEFEIGQLRTNVFLPMLGLGIFSTDGKAWQHSRALLRPQFAREQVSDLDLEEQHVQNLMQALPMGSGKWTTEVDLSVLFFRLTLDTATEFLFGESINSQLAALSSSTETADSDDFSYAFDKAQQRLGECFRLGDFYWLGHTREFHRLCARVHAFIDPIVHRAIAQQHADTTKEKPLLPNSNNSEESSGKYIFLHAITAETTDPLALRSQLLNILVAGRDTTASLLSWLFALLTLHPAVFQQLRAAVLADFGPYTTDTDAITFASLKNCAYLQHTLHETLRLFPSVPFNSRRAAVNTTLPRGGGPDGSQPVFVPKGCEVHYSVHVMQREAEHWDEDAGEFRPERWQGRKMGWEYLPFNGGPRVCLGQQLALTEAGYVVVRILQRFEGIEAVGDSWEAGWDKEGLTLNNKPGNGVNVRLREARE